MIIAGEFSFNGGLEVIKTEYPRIWREVNEAIEGVDGHNHRTKASREKTMPGRMLYSPSSLNSAFKREFANLGWANYSVRCDYSDRFYVAEYGFRHTFKGMPYRDMDFVKDRVGVEVQFGKYAFMVYNVCAKMTIFSNLDVIDVGIEIVPVKRMQAGMSTGVSFFEQFVWDLERRGTADIDIPVAILGIDIDM